jgi:hypothetical protein
MSHDVNILVNGNRCKQYHHNGKIFIEAKEGSEYAIEIKNNEWKRILAVCSVDGLDILSGKPATEDGPGYVLSPFNNAKFDGFRVSDDKVAKFVFGAKGSSYAASKEDGSERNVGVIGIRIFSEKEKPAPIVIREDHHHHHWPKYPSYPYDGTPINPPYRPYPIWCDRTWSSSLGDDVTYGCNLADMSADEPMDMGQERGRSGPTRSVKGSITSKGMTLNSLNTMQSLGGQLMNASFNASNASTEALRGFDMGTKWGEAKESKVVEVDFERGSLVLTTNIYYASRQSLLEMGVPLGSEKQVNFPEAFADSKYAKPPKGWKA